MWLLPLVRQLRFMNRYTNPPLLPEIFNAKSLVYFSALTNVQELGFYQLDLPSFIPQAKQYLEPFMPRLRSLALMRPEGPHHLLLHLIALFPNLDDFRLVSSRVSPRGLVPIPQSAPLLRGRLTLMWPQGEEFLRDLSELSGGLQFQHMDLFEAGCSRFLLGACAKTLETLRIHPTRWIGRGGNLDYHRLSDPPTYRSSRITTTGL